MPQVKNVVLVHGAWANGSSWSKVVPLLQDAGLKVSCTHHPLSGLDADVAVANRIIDAQDGPTILVGHSYGGAIITVAGKNAKVVGLVYVAAFAPEVGETLAGLAAPYGQTSGLKEVYPIEDGYLLFNEKGINEGFAQDLTDEEKKVLFGTQSATSGSILGTVIPFAAWHEKPSWFVVASNDRTISPDQERFTAERMGAKTITVPTSHVAMLAAPKEVAALIIEAASGK
jgi:pimeloyl-ACP methyl ester carboxylesterase